MSRAVRRWIRRVAILLVLIAAVVAVRFTILRPDPVPVTVFRVEEGRVEQAVTNSKSGTVKSRHRAAVGPEIGGRVAAVPVREGDVVRKGDVLLRLADEAPRAQVVLREASVEAADAAAGEACTAAANAAREYDRNVALARDRVVSEQALEDVRTRMETTAAACAAARARTLEAKAALDAARVDLDRTVVRAPFDGVVAEVRAEIGEWVTPSPTGIPIPAAFDVIDLEAIYVSAPLDEVDVARVRAGMPVRVTLDALPDASFPGTVARVAPYVQDFEEQNRTFEVEVELDDRDFARSLSPGASADVEIVLESKEESLRIPSYALIEGRRVLVVEGDRLRSREVETGLRNWDFVEVTDGLGAGEAVVVSLDRAEVKDGARARIESVTER